MGKKGVLLINVGTPDEPTVKVSPQLPARVSVRP